MSIQMQDIVKIAKIDISAAELLRENSEALEKRDAIKNELSSVESDLGQLRSRLSTFESDQSKRTTEIIDLNAAIDEKNGRLKQLKTNQEYQAALKELDAVKKKISDCENKNKTGLEKSTSLKEKIEELETLQKERSSSSASEIAEIEGNLESFDGKLKAFESEKDTIFKDVSPKVKTRYMRIRKRSEQSFAISIVSDDASCGNCKLRLPPQVFNAVLQGDVSQSCVSCSCILAHSGINEEEDA